MALQIPAVIECVGSISISRILQNGAELLAKLLMSLRPLSLQHLFGDSLTDELKLSLTMEGGCVLEVAKLHCTIRLQAWSTTRDFTSLNVLLYHFNNF